VASTTIGPGTYLVPQELAPGRYRSDGARRHVLSGADTRRRHHLAHHRGLHHLPGLHCAERPRLRSRFRQLLRHDPEDRLTRRIVVGVSAGGGSQRAIKGSVSM